MADRLRAPPRAARALTGSGALPKIENLVRKTPEDLIRTLRRFGIDPDIDAIAARARKAGERLDRVISEGITPDEHFWESYDKQIERDVTRSLQQMTKAAIRNYKLDRASRASKWLLWQTVGDEGVCPSCEARHGKIKTKAQWDALGRPGSSSLLCGAGCRCDLIPVEPD